MFSIPTSVSAFPLKSSLGNFIEALQMGADTIVMVGSGPPCRLGLYDLVQKVILEDMGLHYRWLTIPPRLTWQAIWKNHEETKELRKELSAKNILLFPYGLWMGWKKMMACETLEQLAMKVRPREIKKGETQKRLKKALSWVDEAKTPRPLRRPFGQERPFFKKSNKIVPAFHLKWPSWVNSTR